MASERVSPWIYVVVFLVLSALTVLTVSMSMLRLHPWHLAIGSCIGGVKAVLVALFFMHLVKSEWRTWLVAGVGLFWLAILIVLALTDYTTRSGSSF